MSKNNKDPHVVIVGAGPAGLLAAILMDEQCGVRNMITVLEKSPVADPWSTKSYSINLSQRGMDALQAASGVLSNVQDVAASRTCVVIETSNGKRTVIPRNRMALSRPNLVECLEDIITSQRRPRVTVRRGMVVTGVNLRTERDDDDDDEHVVEIDLDDGSTVRATHVVAADGKWSAVRMSIPELADKFVVKTEPSFGVHMMFPIIPDGWTPDGTTVFKPASNPYFYIIAAPLPSGECSISMVCFDEILKQHPWLAPPQEEEEDGGPTTGWEADYSAMPSGVTEDSKRGTRDNSLLKKNLENLFQAELPVFYKSLSQEGLDTVRVNRRVSWLEPVVKDSDDGGSKEAVCYSAANGRVVLIGDSAHAMTPSIGEGCNCAMESAVALVEALPRLEKDGNDDASSRHLTVEELTAAFLEYGRKRPAQVWPVQSQSAKGSKYQNNPAK